MTLKIEDRLTYNAKANFFFVNFEGLHVGSRELVREIQECVERKMLPLKKKVYTFVNYDNSTIDPGLINYYSDMVQSVTNRFYSEVTRYTTSAFLKMKLGSALRERQLAPHIFDNNSDAIQALRKG